MQKSIEQYLEGQLQKRAEEGTLRQLYLAKKGIDFFSNDYLGLVKNKIVQVSTVENTGATGSRLLSGNSLQAIKLEDELAAFHQQEAALLFNSGYDANLGLMSALGNRHTIFLYDELSHASIIDGIRLSFCKQSFRFKHNDKEDLKAKLEKHSATNTQLIVVVESVYSMEGDEAPLAAIADICAQYQVALVVDEAHATGVLGLQGEGLVQQLNIQDKVFARIHTFGKAVGCHGAVIVGKSVLKQYLINYARSFIFTTALPAQTFAAIANSYQYMAANNDLREKLRLLIQYFNKNKEDTGICFWKESFSPIQSFIVNSNELAAKLLEACQKAGINVSAIRSPTVAKGAERLRICLHSFNTEKEIDLLFKTIKLCINK